MFSISNPLKEMLMPQPKTKPRTQLDLFEVRPTRPRWTDLPSETREEATRYLAELVRHHAEYLAYGKESEDERKD